LVGGWRTGSPGDGPAAGSQPESKPDHPPPSDPPGISAPRCAPRHGPSHLPGLPDPDAAHRVGLPALRAVPSRAAGSAEAGRLLQPGLPAPGLLSHLRGAAGGSPARCAATGASTTPRGGRTARHPGPCPCCGTRFGVDLRTPFDPNTHRELRRRWVEAACRWWSTEQRPPQRVPLCQPWVRQVEASNH
jgi:hypothetical protein